MNPYVKVGLKSLGSVAAAAAAFCIGFLLGAGYYATTIAPDAARKYPHDGQIGLGTFVYGINWGAISSLIVFLLGIVWTVMSSRRLFTGQKDDRSDGSIADARR